MLLALVALTVWAAVDFSGLFVLFHRISFTNDLWLMDYRRDLIVRLMPIGLFMDYAAGIGAIWAGLQLTGAILCGRGARRCARTQVATERGNTV